MYKKINNKRYKRRSDFYKYFLYFLLVLFLLILTFLIVVNFNLLDKNKVYKTEIVDECSFIVGNLIHKISDGDACKLACITECQFLKKEYFSHSFLRKEESCNKCYCECLG